MARTGWPGVDGRLSLLAGLLIVTVAFSLLIVPRATSPTASDTLLGLAQLTWWALWNVVGLLLIHLMLRPPRD